MEPGDLSGAVLDGRYHVLERLAEGAMGVVYRAERVKLGRIVAIKVLHDELPEELSSRKRFEIEATAMAKLEHPHCAAVLDVGIHDGRPFVVMDFVSGQSLKELIAQGPVPAVRAAEIVRQVLSGLAHAHELGIIHRDIKPANIVLSQKTGLGDHVKILDFGLARFSNAETSNLTTGIVVGTPAYMAPEQIRGTPIDHRADLYACGVLLFELLTGAKPFTSEHDDPVEVCSMHLKVMPPRLADMQPGIEFGELEAVVARALAKNRDDRYASAEEFAAALDIVPRRRASTPVAGIAVTGAAPQATPSGWAVPPEAVPASPPVFTPVAPASATPSQPVDASAPQPVAEAPPPYSPPVEVLGAAPSPMTATPAASPPEGTPAVPPPAESPPPRASGLPSDFDLSRAIPQPSVAVPESSLSIPQATPDLSPAAIPDVKATVAFLGAPPAGPSPLAAPDAPALPSPIAPVALPAAPAAPTLPFTRRQLAIGGGSFLALIVLIAIIASATGGSVDKPVETPPPTAGSEAPPPAVDPEEQQVAKARDLIDRGQTGEAIEQLTAARKVFPENAQLAFLLGKLQMERQWWSAGLKHLRDAIRYDPGFRSDPELIKMVLKAFITPRDYHAELGGFLQKDIGEPARPYLEETARDHPSANVRKRAQNELKKLR